MRTARNLQLAASSGAAAGVRGSVYAYIVGLVAGDDRFRCLGGD